MRVLVYDRNDSPLFEVTADELYGLVRDEQLDGPRSLTITTTHVLQKNMRVLVCDATGRWHEYVVEGCDEEHGKGNRPIGTYWCSWSMQHDLELTVVSKMPNGGVSTALAAVLSGTKRWTAGTVTKVKTASASMYEMGGWEAVAVMCDAWECEVDDEITVDMAGVVQRRMAALEHVGSDTATRRFDYGNDMKSIKRSVDEEPVFARIIPKGMGEETDTGYYGRRIGIESVNGGIPWLENATTAPYLRVPDGDGGWEYPTRYVVNDEFDDPADLKAWALANLDEWTAPKVTYGADLCQFQVAGLDANGVQLGDEVQVVDRAFGEDGLRIAARVVSLRVNELDPADMALVIGDAPANMATGLTTLAGTLSDVKSTVEVMNGGSMTTADYLSRLVDRLNYAINAQGGYSYLVPGLGMVTYDVPVADPADPVEASAVVEIRGGTVRIADSKNQDGTWQYKTVFTSGHLAADVVTAANITAGYIGSSSGTFIDLDNGIAQFGDTSGTWTQVATNAFNVRQGATDVLATFGSNGSRIGKYDESHLDMDSRNINLIDEFGNSYFKMSDLRNYAGLAFLNEVFYGNGTKTQFDVSFSVYSVSGVRVDGASVPFTPPASSYSRTVTLDAAPSSGARIVIAYSTESEFAKAFTIGRRNADASIGGYSYAEGFDVDASGSYSHAEGRDTHSVGIGSHAEGNETEACGDDSHAEGHWTQARGAHSHSEGFFSVASGDNSHAQNRYTIAASTDQTAIGRMNVEDANGTYALIVGNGDQLQGTRSNALTVDWDGNVTPYGNVYSCMKNVDTSLANNGVSSNFYRNFGIRDKNNRYTLFCQTGAMTDGSVRAEFAARNYGTGANVTNLIRLIVDNAGNRSVELSVPTAWRTALGMSVWPSDTSGTNTSGTFLRGDGVWSAILDNILSLRDSSINRDAASVTADDWGDRYLRLLDKDSETIGSVRCVQRNGGRMDVMLIVYNEKSDGTQVENIIRAGVDKTGACSYGLSDPAAFRTALALNTWTAVTAANWVTLNSGWTVNYSGIQYNAALGIVRVRIDIKATSAQTAGNKTLGTIASAYRPKTFRASIPSLTSSSQACYLEPGGNLLANISAVAANGILYYTGEYHIGA